MPSLHTAALVNVCTPYSPCLYLVCTVIVVTREEISSLLVQRNNTVQNREIKVINTRWNRIRAISNK